MCPVCAAECNPCLSGPCLNGGRCNAVDEESYECQCPEGLTGKLCSEPEVDDPCESSPCGAGATCLSLADDTVTCLCPAGRHGKFCELGTVHVSSNTNACWRDS
jgi:hypothetical protein